LFGSLGPLSVAIAVLATVVPGPHLLAQEMGRIEGKVTDPGGAPLEGAQVLLARTARSALSDKNGRYVLDHVPPATYVLMARRIGFTAHEVRNVVVESGKTTTIDIQLTATGALGVEEIVVSVAGAPGFQLQQGMVAAPFLEGRPYPWQFGPPPADREEYGHLVENPFLGVTANPLSTFSVDVDRASYANVRRLLMDGRLPPVDAVRIEEMLNYFTYDYAEPSGPHPIAVHLEIAPAPWRPAHRLVRIGLQGQRIETDRLPASNLVFLLDVSGSMWPPNKLPMVKAAFRLLVDQLRAKDRVAIVVYAGAAGQVLASTPGDRKTDIVTAIDNLEAGGSTAGGAGIRLAYDVAQRHFLEGGNNRVILATDGDFNVGVSGEGELVRLIEEKRKSGVFLTVVSVGEGNLQDRKMEQLADHGNGNYAYLDNILEARKVFVQELGGTLHTIAKDVKIQVEFNPARVSAYRLIGYENRLLRDEEFDDDAKDAGDVGSGHSVTALYEIIPVGVTSDVKVGVPDSLRYQTVTVDPSAAASPELVYVKLRYKAPDGDESRLLTHAVLDAAGDTPSSEFRFQAAVAEFALLLRQSEFRGDANLARVLERARGSLGADVNGYRAEFLRLVDAAQSLGLGKVASR
jgi:Ca-activated chloride channel family protein